LFHLLAAAFEGGVLSHQRVHTPHAGRALLVLDIQFDVGGELSSMAVWAQIVRACDFGPAHGRQDWPGLQSAATGLLATGASNAALFGGRLGEAQQLSERGSSGPMHGRAHRHLDRFQVQVAVAALAAEDHMKQLLYFARDLLADRFGCVFFPVSRFLRRDEGGRSAH
jgi:hypothetical protein